MTIYEALKNIPPYKRLYFTWKHEIRFRRNIPKKTKEELLKEIGRKSLDGMIKWERSKEYHKLVLLLLESKIANDLEDIYEITSAKAREGDEKAIKLLLELHKQIQINAKLAVKTLEVKSKEDDNDDLFLD